MHLDRRLLPVDVVLRRVDLVGVGRLPLLGSRRPEAGAKGADQQLGAGVDQAGAQLGGGLFGPDGETGARVHRTGVETLLQLHEAHARLGVAGEDGALDGRRSPPPREQREVEVDHRQGGQDVGLDDAAEGDDDTELGAGVDDVVDPVGDRQAEPGGSGLDRAGHERASPAPALVGAGDDEANVVAVVHEGAQRRHRHLGRAQEGELQWARASSDGRPRARWRKARMASFFSSALMRSSRR